MRFFFLFYAVTLLSCADTDSLADVKPPNADKSQKRNRRVAGPAGRLSDLLNLERFCFQTVQEQYTDVDFEFFLIFPYR